MRGLILRMPVVILFAALHVAVAQFYCADQLQQCFTAVADANREINAFKQSAFKTCVRRPACHEERRIFDECFLDSLAATHLNSDVNQVDGDSSQKSNFFADASFKYRSALDHCFVSSPFVPRRTRFGPSVIDDDAAYARAIYGYELADQLWGLPEVTVTRPSLDTAAICRIRPDSHLRIFGSGISRTAPGADPKLNNISTACMLDDEELTCYRQALNESPQFIQIVYNRDYALRTCIQTIRQQTVCRMNDVSRLRACLCGVREQFDGDLRDAILTCVRSKAKPVLQVQLSTSLDDSAIQQQVEPANLKFDTPGVIINGQCLCSCDGGASKFGRRLKNIETLNKKGVEQQRVQSGPRFAKGTPRFMQPSEAAGNVFWGAEANSTRLFDNEDE